MNELEKYRAFVRGKMASTKNPLGPTTVALVGKTAQKKTGFDLMTLEGLLTELRKEGAVYCTNGRWWTK